MVHTAIGCLDAPGGTHLQSKLNRVQDPVVHVHRLF
jgi:hypothetical protein